MNNIFLASTLALAILASNTVYAEGGVSGEGCIINSEAATAGVTITNGIENEIHTSLKEGDTIPRSFAVTYSVASLIDDLGCDLENTNLIIEINNIKSVFDQNILRLDNFTINGTDVAGVEETSFIDFVPTATGSIQLDLQYTVVYDTANSATPFEYKNTFDMTVKNADIGIDIANIN